MKTLQAGPDLPSEGPRSEKMWGPFTSKKTGDLFLVATVRMSAVSSPITSVFRACKKFAAPFVGPPFCGGSCSAKHAEHA